MDVTKAPSSADITSLGVGTAANAAAASQGNAAAGASTASNTSAAVAAPADRLDIQPLDVAAALQILIAEVRAELPALQAAEMVLSEIPKAQAAAPAGTDVTASPSPLTQPAGLALLESQAMPLSRAALVELPDLPSLLGAGPSQPPILEPLPGAQDLAAVTLHPAVRLSEGETAAAGGPASEVGALVASEAGAGMAPESSTGGRLPLTALPAIPASLDLDPLKPLLMQPEARAVMPSALTLLSSPAQAAPVLLRMFLQAVPQETHNPAAWSAIVNQLEDTLLSALDRAVATVEQWHDVPQVVVDAARETRGLVMTQLGEEPQGPLGLRPEWVWLSPQMERFRRRRRLVRRGLSDPDLWPLREDDGRGHDPGERKQEP